MRFWHAFAHWICLASVLVALLGSAVDGQSVSRKRIAVVSSKEEALHDLLVQAKAAADKQDYATAESDYQKYLAQKPDDAAAHFDLGFVYTAQHEKEKAESEYRRAIELNPKMTEAYLNLGISLMPDDPQSAVVPLRKVTELNYSYAKGHYLLGAAEERAGDSRSAMQE